MITNLHSSILVNLELMRIDRRTETRVILSCIPFSLSIASSHQGVMVDTVSKIYRDRHLLGIVDMFL